jgi:N-acetylneuraminic acid mutarotase
MMTRGMPFLSTGAMLLPLLLAACDGAAEVSNGEPRSPSAQGEWTQRAPMPQARTEVSVATDGQRAYVIGGFARRDDGSTVAPRAMFIYDPAEDRWTTSPDSIPEGVNHSGFVYLNGRLYIVGGFRGATFQPTGAVRIYDLATRTWTDGPPLPTPRGALSVAVLDGRIHAIGGNAANASALDPAEHNVGADGSSVGTHEVFDPATGKWTRLAPMPTARNHAGAAAVNGKIHVVAGRVGDNATLTAHEVYDPATNSWSAAPPVPPGRSGIAVVTLRGAIYVFGGETFGPVEKTFDEAERYDPATGRWASMPRMPTARHGLGAAAIGNAIYVIAGGPRPGFAYSAANERLTLAR